MLVSENGCVCVCVGEQMGLLVSECVCWCVLMSVSECVLVTHLREIIYQGKV